ncbi:MAG: SusC/RagA family TonB-linked outer membrane protein, partial [Bacteroidales bacterium]
YLKNTQTGTITGSSGEYSFSAMPGNYIIVFSFVGYVQKEIEMQLSDNETLDVALEVSETEIEEVQITAQRKFFGNMNYGREIPSIDAEVIAKQNANNASDILHARLAGVWATKTSGAPGDHQKIRIRGQNSFFSSAEPLYVVDGVPVPIVNLSSLGISDLNIHDIENITVLKDASSSALYGFQGANGVVLIDTKKGGENEINFSAKFGYQWFDRFYDLMSSKDQLTAFDSAESKTGIRLRLFYPAYSDTLCSRDWQKEIFSPGNLQEYQLSGSGSLGSLDYYLSGNYTDYGGIIENSSYKRYTFSARLGTLFWKRLAVEVAYRGSVQKNKNNQDQYNGNRLIFEGINRSPCLECTPDSFIYDENNHQNLRIYYNYPQLNSTELPQSIIRNNNHDLGINTHALSGFIRLRLTDHLSMDLMESFMVRHADYNSGYMYYYFHTSGAQTLDQVVLQSREDVILLNHQYNLSYYNTFGKHDIGIVLAGRHYKDNLWWNVDSIEGSLSDHYYLRNSMAAYGPKGSVLRKMNSYLGHVSYNYRKTYFISLVANLSQVKEGLHINYYSLFPSVALSWDIAREKPFRDIEWTDHFNVFVNWGRSGNYPLNGLANDLYEDVPYTFSNSTSYYPSVLQFANHYLKHESTSETDYGLKASFLKNRFSVNATYYSKKISNLIIQRDIPAYYAGGKMYLNIGEISVNGFEAGIDVIPVRTGNFTWYLQGNFSASSQSVTKLYEGEDMFFTEPDPLLPEFIIREGEPLGNIYGYRTEGKWTTADEQAGNNHYLEHMGMKFLNADSSDNVLDENDKVIIGNSIPDYTWNLSCSFKYKNFTLDMVWYAITGVDKFNATRAATVMTGNNRDVYRYINDSISSLRYRYIYESSEFIDNAGFIRLKTVTFSYEPSRPLIRNVGMRFSVSFENLLTLTKYRGYDPEATIFTDNNFSDNAIDRGSYPNPKAVYVTVSLKF